MFINYYFQVKRDHCILFIHMFWLQLLTYEDNLTAKSGSTSSAAQLKQKSNHWTHPFVQTKPHADVSQTTVNTT